MLIYNQQSSHLEMLGVTESSYTKVESYEQLRILWRFAYLQWSDIYHLQHQETQVEIKMSW